jgi:hypothetical protein
MEKYKSEQEKEREREQQLINEISEMGKKAGVIIDVSQPYRLRDGHLNAIKELLANFMPFEKIKGCLKEIDVQAEENYLSWGCVGYFDYPHLRAEIPSYITFDNQNPENFYAVFIHEAIGHPIEMRMKKIDEKTQKLLRENHRKIARQKAFFKGVFGRVYPEDELMDFGQFIAEFTKQYCLEGEDLRKHMESLPEEQRKAYQNFYDFFKDFVYNGREFINKDLESLKSFAENIKKSIYDA